jgi:heterodisulfide reductase subunit A
MTEERHIGTVLVVGAGISGIKAALELAETGYKVILTDISPHVGGILDMLDYQFPSDHCGMCRMLPMAGRESGSQFCLRKGLYHDNIEILASTDIAAIDGDVGAYKVQLVTKPAYIDNDICCECGQCVEVCPVETRDEFNCGLTTRKAIYQPVPHGTPKKYVLDAQTCTRCGQCVDVCQAGAINLDAVQTEQIRNIQAIIFASGIKLHDPNLSEEGKSYTVSPDVVTALQFERMLSPSGAYDGTIRRPSDGKEAKRFAWIQCVGSRNRHQKAPYCSSICCMFALKEAVLAHKKGGDGVETTIFYMDMRTFGKNFYRYQEKAEKELGVEKIRCRVQAVRKDKDGQLLIRFFDPATQTFSTRSFDVVILSTGQNPFAEHKRVAELTGVELTEDGLLKKHGLEKVCLSKPGIYTCGSLMGLTDISEAITSGTAAAGKVCELLSAQNVQLVEHDIPLVSPELDNKVPAVLVILCGCGEKSKPHVQGLDKLTAALQNHPGVTEVHVIDSLCTKEGQEELRSLLRDTQGNRLLLGSCNQYLYRNTFQKIIRAAGMNMSLVKIFDFLEDVEKLDFSIEDDTVDALVRTLKPEIENLKFKVPLHEGILPVEHRALVIGGGISGMSAAVSLAQRGVDVILVERSAILGGYAGNQTSPTITGLDTKKIAESLQDRMAKSSHITVHMNSRVLDSKGILGAFETTIQSDGSEEKISLHHGVTILATGCTEDTTTEYGYGTSDRILTQGEFRQKFAANEIDTDTVKNIVMIQCVGSREKGKKEYCSRVCCLGALGNAFAIKKKNPEARIIVLYRDIMTYGDYEKYYTQARREGIIFVNYGLDSKPEVELKDGLPVVRFTEHVLNVPTEIQADLLILSTGLASEASNSELGKIFGDITCNQDGFFVEADSKWRPVECGKAGFYVVGTAHSPRTIRGCVMQAQAAAQKAYTYLSERIVYTPREISITHDALCSRCQRCVEACPYDARRYDEKYDRIVVDPATCQACGICAATCPNNAAEILGWKDKQMMAVLDSMLM